jgi:hypothetical protein
MGLSILKDRLVLWARLVPFHPRLWVPKARLDQWARWGLEVHWDPTDLLILKDRLVLWARLVPFHPRPLVPMVRSARSDPKAR